MSNETTLKIRTVGYYTHGIAEPDECEVCHNADWGDVLVEGICGKCLLEFFLLWHTSTEA